MKFAFYKGQYGNEIDKVIILRTGGPYSHVEAILSEEGGVARCASSSLRDGGVRFKDITLEAQKWDIVELAGIEPAQVAAFFAQHLGAPYDVRGAINFVVPVGSSKNGWFCSEAVGAAIGLKDAWRFEPNALAAVIERLGGTWLPR